MIALTQIMARIDDYLAGNTNGNSLISYIDDAVSSDDVYRYPSNPRDIILHYQDILAFYVDDPLKRTEHRSYFGPAELREIVSKMRLELHNSLQE